MKILSFNKAGNPVEMLRFLEKESLYQVMKRF